MRTGLMGLGLLVGLLGLGILSLALVTWGGSSGGDPTALGSSDKGAGLISTSVEPDGPGTGEAPCASDDGAIELCRPRDVSHIDLFSGSSHGNVSLSEGPASSVEDVLEEGLHLAGASPVHLAMRGTADGDSIRCSWRGIARTPEQREDAIRFWLGLGENDPIPETAFLEALFAATFDMINPLNRETAKSNFLSIALGGLSTEYLFLACYADYSASEYLLGTGDGTITVVYDRMDEARSYGLYAREHANGNFPGELLSQGEYESELIEVVNATEEALAELIGDSQSVLFLAPMGAHSAIAVEGWQVVELWDVQTGDGVVNAVRYGVPQGDPEHTQTLANLKSRITAATSPGPSGAVSGQGEGSPGPTRIANVSGLQQYYRDIGAYGDITPDDGSTETFTPAQPPATLTCASGTAVADSSTNRGLVHDCEALLASKDTLRGSATLDWSSTTSINSWEGITTESTPTRVTKVELDDEDLTGSIPSELGTLFELTHLDLSSNSLTGDIPAELSWLHNLQEIKLTGNSLTGCIPIALESVPTNDLASLNLLYCQPPAPSAPTAGTGSETSVQLSWTAVPNTNSYRVEYREGTVGSWTVDGDTITTTTHTVDGLECGRDHQFRLSAFGSGTIYTAAWSDPSEALTASAICVTPVFDEESYAFSVGENASIGDSVGVAAATDPNDDSLTYTIVSGNEDGKFAIDPASGAITVAGALDYETKSRYTLTVEVSDGANDASISVEITVKEVNLPPVFPAEGFSFSVNESAGLPAPVGFVVATDPEGDVVTYAITGGNPNGQFAMDYHRGLILVWRSLNFNARSSYTLTVKAMDARGNASSTTATITVVQTAEDPPPAPTGLTTLLEDAGNLIVTWNEVASASMYRLRHRTDSNADWITSAATTDTTHTFSAVTCGATYEVQVQAQGDGVSYTAEWSDPSESVSRKVPLCPAPVFGEPSYELTVAEDASDGTVVGTVTATHPDQTKLTYSITAGNDDDKFAIATGGVITVVAALDREETATYTLTIVATEPRGKSGTAAVAITVANVNEAPSFDPDGYSFTVAENTAIGFSLGSVSATDPDEDTLTYSITDGNDDGKFSIESSGAITVAKALDYETAPSHTLAVEATDPGGLSDTAEVSIGITDVNEAPSFDAEEYSFTVAEDSTVGHSVGTALATDPDDGDTLTYSISGEAFGIDASGTITVGAALDHEAGESYRLIVTAEDGSGLSDTAEVSIEITDVNEAPSFDAEEYSFTVAENAILGEMLGNVSATDPDDGDALSYSISEEAFTISTGGAVTVARLLDYETVESYSLIATVEDLDGASGTTKVFITVSDVDETPAFDEEEYSFTVSEDAAVGSVVGALTASDANERQGEALTYSAEGDTAFTIDANTGTITVASTLDYETYLTHELTATVTDETDLTDTAAVNIRVRDVAEITPPVPAA